MSLAFYSAGTLSEMEDYNWGLAVCDLRAICVGGAEVYAFEAVSSISGQLEHIVVMNKAVTMRGRLHIQGAGSTKEVHDGHPSS